MDEEERAPFCVLSALDYIPDEPPDRNGDHVCVHEVVVLIPVALQRAAGVEQSVDSHTCSVNPI